MSINSKPRAASLSVEAIASTLKPFRGNIAQDRLLAIQEYVHLLLEWNKSINLTGIEDPEEIVARHFGESLFAESLLRIGESRLADVGTGAGFPGLALKITNSALELTLFESNTKKCAFLTEIVQRLRLDKVKIVRERYERSKVMSEFDFVCSRALGDYPVFLPWAGKALRPGGRLVLWLGTDESIRIERRKGFIWEPPFPIPESKRRVILVGRVGGGPECST